MNELPPHVLTWKGIYDLLGKKQVQEQCIYYNHFFRKHRKILNHLICKKNKHTHTGIHRHTSGGGEREKGGEKEREIWKEYTQLLTYSYDLTVWAGLDE